MVNIGPPVNEIALATYHKGKVEEVSESNLVASKILLFAQDFFVDID